MITDRDVYHLKEERKKRRENKTRPIVSIIEILVFRI
jgi:hypothetical protein